MIGAFFDNSMDLLNLLDEDKVLSKYKINDYDVYIIEINGQKVLIADSGYTKCQVGALIAEIMSQFKLTMFIQAGNCAGLCKWSKTLDVAIATNCLQYDVDFTPLGYCKNEIPVINQTVFYCNKELIKCAQIATCNLDQKSCIGKFVSADKFMACTNFSDDLRRCYGADFLDSESGTIAELAFIYKVPFICVKSVSNYGDNAAECDYGRYKKQANAISAKVAFEMLDLLTKEINPECMEYIEMTDEEIYDVLNESNYAMLSVSSDNQPYSVPMFYRFIKYGEKYFIFMISSQYGKKMDNMKTNEDVCVTFSSVGNFKYRLKAETYRSVVSFGSAYIIDLKSDNVYKHFGDQVPDKTKQEIDSLIADLNYNKLPCCDECSLILIIVDEITGRKFF